MSDQLVIRPRRDADIPALARVLAEVHSLDGYPVEGVADAEAWLVSSQMLAAWAAVLGRGLVGQVMLMGPSAGDDAANIWMGRHGAGDVAVVGRLFVAPRARGRHAGRKLMEAAASHAEELGRRAVLDVMDKDTAAIRLYERLGWRPIGSFRHSHSRGQGEPATAYEAPSRAR